MVTNIHFRKPLFLLLFLLISFSVSAQKNKRKASEPVMKLEGKIDQGIYYSPEDLFQVPVLRMKNPFIKEPSPILDWFHENKLTSVEFQVLDLGEKYRFGALLFDGKLSSEDPEFLDSLFDQVLEFWINPSLKREIILEKDLAPEKPKGLARVYLIENSSILFRMVGKNEGIQEEALISTAILPTEGSPYILFVLGQFDMENKGGHYTIDTENGRIKIASRRMEDLISMIQEFKIIEK